MKTQLISSIKRYLAQSAQWRHIMFGQKITFSFLLTETDGSGQLNISMQQLATYFDLVMKIFINAPTMI